MLSSPSPALWTPPTSHPAFPWVSLLQLIPAITMDVDYRPNETSPVPPSTFTTSRSPYAGEFFGAAFLFGAAFPGSSRLPWPSLSLTSSALPGSPSGANLSTLQDYFMLRAAVLLSFLRRLQRFSTISHPIALVACYVAPWQLPRPDLHRLADDSFQDTPAGVGRRPPVSVHEGNTLSIAV
jgi:hypothetical protein